MLILGGIRAMSCFEPFLLLGRRHTLHTPDSLAIDDLTPLVTIGFQNLFSRTPVLRGVEWPFYENTIAEQFS